MFSHIFKGVFLTPFGSHPPNFSVRNMFLVMLGMYGLETTNFTISRTDFQHMDTSWYIHFGTDLGAQLRAPSLISRSTLTGTHRPTDIHTLEVSRKQMAQPFMTYLQHFLAYTCRIVKGLLLQILFLSENTAQLKYFMVWNLKPNFFHIFGIKINPPLFAPKVNSGWESDSRARLGFGGQNSWRFAAGYVGVLWNHTSALSSIESIRTNKRHLALIRNTTEKLHKFDVVLFPPLFRARLLPQVASFFVSFSRSAASSSKRTWQVQ